MTEIAFAALVLAVAGLLVLVIRFASVNEAIPAMVATEPPTVHPSELQAGDIIRIIRVDAGGPTRHVEVDSVRGAGEVWIVRWHDEDGAGESTYPDDARVRLALREDSR